MKEAILRLSLQSWLFAHTPSGWSGKTSPAYYRASAERILPPSYRCSSDGKSGSQTESGERPDSSPEPPDASAWVGECLTLNIPEFNNFQGRSRSEGVVSSLSGIICPMDLVVRVLARCPPSHQLKRQPAPLALFRASPGAACRASRRGGASPPHISPSKSTLAQSSHEPRLPTRMTRRLRCGIALGNC